MHSLQKQQKIASWVHSTEPRGSLPCCPLVAEAMHWLLHMQRLGGQTSEPAVTWAPPAPACSLARGSQATGFVSADPFSLPHSSYADSRCEHLLCQGAEETLLQRRRASNHQMWGAISRCWGNVSLPQLGKVLTTIMAESLCNPFFSLLFTPAKAISKFKAVTELGREGDDYRVQ